MPKMYDVMFKMHDMYCDKNELKLDENIQIIPTTKSNGLIKHIRHMRQRRK